MNKAQKSFLDKTFSNYAGETRLFSQETFVFYANEYNKIDPTPDTKKYVVRLAGGSNNDHATVNGIQYDTKEEAVDSIKRFVREYMLNGSYNILNYNAQLAEVEYSDNNAGIVYTRWVEEVE